MRFIEWLNKFKIKVFAPATICYRQMGNAYSELRYCAWLPAFLVFKNEPLDKDGYYARLYVNNKRFKPFWIIPRNAFIEVRQKPKIISAIVGFTLGMIGVTLSTQALVIVGVAALLLDVALMATAAFALGKASTPKSNGVNKPTYESRTSPSLTGAKNELQTGVVPVAFGRSLQVFNYSQYCIPLVRSGYSGNRYRVYSVAGYQNARYSDFRLGDVLLSDYRAASYELQQNHGSSTFIGWDNAQTESFNKELTFDQQQAVYQSAIIYYNQLYSGTVVKLSITQTYKFTNVDYNNWTDKTFDITARFLYTSQAISEGEGSIGINEGGNLYYVNYGTQGSLTSSITITKSDLVSQGDGSWRAVKTIEFVVDNDEFEEYSYTTISPNSLTRGNSQESELICQIISESVTITNYLSQDTTFTETGTYGVNSYNGDKNEIISQSPSQARECDIHFSFPQGLYSIDTNSGSRIRVTIQAEVQWREESSNVWLPLKDDNDVDLYTRDIDGNLQPLSERIVADNGIFTFKTPDDINNADDQFYECVTARFSEDGKYQVRILPVVFTKDDYWVGTINIAEVVWRMPSLPVIDSSILPSVSQIACTFNATTQLDGEVDEFGAIVFPYIKNLKTGQLAQSRNPVDIIYYLLTDTYSNPDPMTDDQIDIDSFLTARQWCEDHNCLCDGIVSEEIKYESIINEIASNNQLYFIPNKWGKAVLRVDTNEDNRPIKALFNAENSWDLAVTRIRGKLGRLLALRCTYIDEETWSEQEITGYWYNNTCNWQPETGKDDDYYKPEKRDLKYISNLDNVKRRIAYELEIANVKNVTATFKIAREVLDLEVLDRVLVADYTRINDGVSSNVESLIYSQDGTQILGVKTATPFVVKENMTITIRSVDTSGEGFNVNSYGLVQNEAKSSDIYFSTPIAASTSMLRGVGFYDIEGSNIYYTGDLCIAGTADILSMVISKIEEVDGEQFTSSITCRLF